MPTKTRVKKGGVHNPLSRKVLTGNPLGLLPFKDIITNLGVVRKPM